MSNETTPSQNTSSPDANNAAPDAEQPVSAAQLLQQWNEEEEQKAPQEFVIAEDDEGGIKEQLLKEQVIQAMQSVYDPEIPINIYDLGLIYDLKIEPNGDVDIKMTLTSPACPVAGILPGQVQAAVDSVPGVREARVELVWDPPFGLEMMSEAARLQLGLL